MISVPSRRRDLTVGACARQDIIAIGQGAARHHASVVEGAPPDDGRRNRALAFPVGGDGLSRLRHRRVNGSRVGGGKASSGFEGAQGAIENHVDEIADPERI